MPHPSIFDGESVYYSSYTISNTPGLSGIGASSDKHGTLY